MRQDRVVRSGRYKDGGVLCPARTGRDGRDAKSRKCRTEGCCRISFFGVAGTKKAEYCVRHAPDAMADVIHRKCRTENCDKGPSFGVAGSKPHYDGKF